MSSAAPHKQLETYRAEICWQWQGPYSLSASPLRFGINLIFLFHTYSQYSSPSKRQLGLEMRSNSNLNTTAWPIQHAQDSWIIFCLTPKIKGSWFLNDTLQNRIHMCLNKKQQSFRRKWKVWISAWEKSHFHDDDDFILGKKIYSLINEINKWVCIYIYIYDDI